METSSELGTEAGVLERTKQRSSGYRDSIGGISGGGMYSRRATHFFPWISGGAGDSSCGSSSVASSSAASASCLSSSWGDCSGSWLAPPAATSSEVQHELRAIAEQMVHDGYIQGLIGAFDGAATCSRGRGADELLLTEWFSQLDVEQVMALHTTGEEDDGDMVRHCFTAEDLMALIEPWIRALLTMVQVLCIRQRKLCAKRSSTVAFIRRLLSTNGTAGGMPDYVQEVVQFVRFSEASIQKMLAFVDAVILAALKEGQRLPELLPGMLQVYACIFETSPTILTLFKEASDLLVFGSCHELQVFDAMIGVFLRKRKKLSDAIWGMTEKVRASFLLDICWQVPPEAAAASAVHETTMLMMNYITLLWRNHDVLKFILQGHHFSKFISDTEGFNSVVNLITDMISCLGHKLEETSLSILDPGLRCIFLLNNWQLVLQRIESLDLPSWALIERCMTQRYIDTYLDISWSPLLCCMFIENPSNSLPKKKHIPFGFRRYLSLEKF